MHAKLAMTRPSGRMVAANARIDPMMNMTPRILYGVICGPLVISPITTTASDSTASKTANSRGAVPGSECKAAHARQIVRRDQGRQRQQDQRHAAVEVLRIVDAHPTRRHGDSDRGENDDGAADRQRDWILQQKRRREKHHRQDGNNQAADQIISPLILGERDHPPDDVASDIMPLPSAYPCSHPLR